ncbi:MAG: DUF3224 domain-containing protein [Devosia sp.]|nr:DUF3224 domain-containing protein [Devosia sp.]
MPKVRGPFEVKLTPQAADEREAATFLGRLNIDKEFHGPLEATSVGQMIAARGERPESAGYVAIERVTGTLDGRTGSFILQHSGHSSPAGQSLTVSVVADSGTEHLTGLSGSMQIDIEPGGKHFYEFDYKL